jgi:small ligand-binding sensory domain FIST
MHLASALSNPPTLTPPATIAREIETQLALPKAPDLLLLFISYSLASSFKEIVDLLRSAIKPTHLLAVVGESIVGTDREVERLPAVSALAITCPEAVVHTFHLAEEQWAELFNQEELLGLHLAPSMNDNPDQAPIRGFFMFADPFTTPVVQLLDICGQRFPGIPILGGMASGMSQPGDTRLALNDEIHTSGVIGVTFAGDIHIDTLISPGCRAVGDTFVVTKGHENIIETLDGKPALAAIEEMVQGLPLLDRQLLANGGLQIGRVIDQGKGAYGRGDFLIRSLVGVRRETGAVLIGDHINTGQTLQFHVRDGRAAHEEMKLLLEGETMLAPSSQPAIGAMLVSCNGRGSRLFDRHHHDVSLTREILGSIPIAGFFAGGEIGPVGYRNFVHAHTAALALFRQQSS